MLADALLIFFSVIRLKPRHNKFVNAIAECTLGVYLFHENHVLSCPNVVDTVFEQLTERGYIGKTALFPLQYLAAVVLVFLVGTLLEFIRQQAIQKPFMNRLTARRGDKLASIDDWFSRL